MASRLIRLTAFALKICVVIGSHSVVRSQDDGSGSSRSSPARATRPQTPDEFYASFWSFMVRRGAAYNSWKVLSRDPSGDDLENPHSTISKTYVNDVGSQDTANLPVGTILVREDYGADRKRQSISVMYRVKDYDKEHGNWYYLKFLEDGNVARGNGKSVAGKVTSCIGCHTKAKGQDFVFSNDISHGDEPKRDKPSTTDRKPKDEERE
jgi:hypothetical protein